MVAPFVKQAWTVSGVLLNMLGQGMVLSFPSCLLPGLKDPSSSIKVDLGMASWLASSVGLSSLLGFFISSVLMEWYGRKLAHALVILPGTTGWIIIYFSKDITTLMIGRILGGITAGATVTLGAVVIGEFTSPEHRGMFLNLKTAAVCLGNTTMHILGHFFHWKTVALCGLVPHIVALCIVSTWPESPAWLASKKRYDESEKAFIWLRGSSQLQEHYQLVKSQKERLTTTNNSFKGKFSDFMHKLGRRDFLKPAFIIFLGAILLEACGRHTFPAYASTIINEINGSKQQSFLYTISIDLIVTASAMSSSVLVKMMKRRTLLFSTGISAVLMLFSVCTYQYLVGRSVIPMEHTWIPLTMLVVYFILANLGCTPIPFVILGEIFPLAHRGAGVAASGVSMSIGLYVFLEVTPYLLASVGFHGTFAVFGGAMCVAMLGLYFILPETKDRTLQEIEDCLNYGKYRDEKTDPEDEEVRLKMMS
ncbi:facilitated trehalose transporter Tret1-like [Ostrinia furnacalis]|uniref:facilitated trehalose transporter Tret1-like n=1 Tax=Ostrinia furnacalis TaxID=93504 RepID=UPI00103B2E7F|nr:facilitated trehalose transporter Tret1-like [Ostrinia furnacalis]